MVLLSATSKVSMRSAVVAGFLETGLKTVALRRASRAVVSIMTVGIDSGRDSLETARERSCEKNCHPNCHRTSEHAVVRAGTAPCPVTERI